MVALTLLVSKQLLYFAINSTLTDKVHIKIFRIYDGEFLAKSAVKIKNCFRKMHQLWLMALGQQIVKKTVGHTCYI
jgi:hypothetical protein